jgi:transcriptional regulator with XRE-family HTH domain
MEQVLMGEWMALRRERLGLTKSAFGREAKLHVSTISQIESGRLVPYPGQMEKIVACFERLEKAKGAWQR